MSWTRRVDQAGCSKRLSGKAAASEEARRTLRYVEPLSAARTPLADLFSILLDDFSEVFDRANKGIFELHLRFPFQESTRPTDVGPSDFWIIGRQRMMGDLAR